MVLIELVISRDQNGFVDQLKQTWYMQAEEMAQCLYLHRSSCGVKYIPSQLVAVVQSTLWCIINQQKGSDETRHLFTELCRFAAALGRRFKPVSQAVDKMLKLVQGGIISFSGDLIDILESPDHPDSRSK